VEKRLALASGKLLANKGELNAALLVYNGLLLEYPDERQILFSIGGVYMKLNRIEEAEETFSKLLKVAPDSVLVNLNLAQIYERTNRLAESRKHYWRIVELKKSPSSVKAARIRYGIVSGRQHLANKQFNLAIAAYDEVQAIDPNKTEALFNKGMAYMQIGNVDEAEKLFLLMLKKNENAFAARLNLAAIYADRKKYDKAKLHYQYIIDNAKGRMQDQAKVKLNLVHTELADNAMREGNVEQGLIEYKKALGYYSGNVKAAFNQGLILIRQRKFEGAQEAFENVVQHMPEDLRARFNLASVYEQRQLFSKAADQYEKMMQIAPTSQEATIAGQRWRVARARGLWAEKDLTAAELLLEEAEIETPDNIEVFIYLGVIKSAKGKSKDAINAFQEVLRRQPNNQGMRFYLAQSYEQLGLDQLAATEYRRIIFTGAQPILLQNAKNRLRAVESRLSGFFRSVNYSFQFDDNLNMNDENPVEELRTDLAFSVTYNQKFGDDWTASLTWRPTYSTYHESHSDYLNSGIDASLKIGSPQDSYNITYGRQDQQGLLNETTVSESENLNLSRNRRVNMPALFGLTPKEYDGEEGIPTSLGTSVSARTISSFGNVPLESVTFSAGLNMSQNVRGGYMLALSYNLSIYRNVANGEIVRQQKVVEDGRLSDDLKTVFFYDSRDYEYNSHMLNLSVGRSLLAGLSGNLGVMFTYTGYVNPDSGARAERLLDTRNNTRVDFNGSLNYQVTKDLSFYNQLSWTKNNSDLPVATIGAKEDEAQQAIASFQSTSLGDYTRFSATFGMRMSF
jgi:tetratricopeptide (TPR) repeat protein